MGVVKLTCSECGGKLELDDSLEQGFCQYCGEKVIIQKDIVQNITNNNIKVDNVTIVNKKDFEIQAGILKKYIGESDIVIIPDNVKKIGEEAFKNQEIIEVKIPDTVVKIENNAFEGCSSLEKIVLPESLKEIDSETFKGCSSLKEIMLPSNVVKIGIGTFIGCSSLEKIVLPESLKEIKGYTLEGCSSLKEIILPSSLIELGSGTFKDCSSLEKIKLPESLQKIESFMFNGCSSLKEIILPSNLVKIGDGAFEECSSLKEIIIPVHTSNIGSGAFYGCSSLEKVDIQNNDTKIDQFAFGGGGCKALYEIRVQKTSSIVENNDTNQKNTHACYVATCVYGSYDCPEVWTLRRYRDYTLAETWSGRLFIKIYYTISPTIVKYFGETKWFKRIWRIKLDKMVNDLQNKGIKSTPYEDREWR